MKLLFLLALLTVLTPLPARADHNSGGDSPTVDIIGLEPVTIANGQSVKVTFTLTIDGTDDVSIGVASTKREFFPDWVYMTEWNGMTSGTYTFTWDGEHTVSSWYTPPNTPGEFRYSIAVGRPTYFTYPWADEEWSDPFFAALVHPGNV